jgi:hypothetical protein
MVNYNQKYLSVIRTVYIVYFISIIMHNPCMCGHGEVIHDYETLSSSALGYERESTYCRYPECNCIHYRPMPKQTELLKVVNF